MHFLRRLVLHALPKVLLSRACGAITAMPLPRRCRPVVHRWFARRYGVELAEVDGELDEFASLQAFFRRRLRAGCRPIAAAPLVWPCDGRVVSSGAIRGGELPQIKDRHYQLADLVGDAGLAAALDGGSQATIYLAPGDYHRVHAPFRADVERVVALPGTLFPVNPQTAACIDRLFARNSRHVFHCRLAAGTPAAVVMVGAYNVGGTLVTRASGGVLPGDELGQFGFGSTVVVLIGPGGPRFDDDKAGCVVRCGGAAG